MRALLLAPVPPDPEGSWAMPPLLHAQLLGLAERNDVTLVVPAGPDPSEHAAVERLRRDGGTSTPPVATPALSGAVETA